MTEQDLKGQSAIVTGGGTGIGKGIALALAAAGVKVVLTGRRPEPIDEAVAEITSQDGVGLAVTGDVSLEEDVDKVVRTAVEAFGTVDILVNNAGIGGYGYLHELPVTTWDEVIGINLRGPFLMSRMILPFMRRQKRGHIINISSESGLKVFQKFGAYGVSKHALIALSEYLQEENQELGIRVNAICPGMVITPLTKGRPGLNEEKSLYPEDIADLVMWLVSRRPNVKIGTPVLIQTMENPWE